MALSRKAVGQIAHDAHELNTKTVNKIGLEADAILKKDIDLNNTGADKAGQDAADTDASAFMMLAVILGLAVIAGIAVSCYLVRDVSTGIASIVTPMQTLGQGDLTAMVPHRGEKTEIGAMADTLQVFKEVLIAKKAATKPPRSTRSPRSIAAAGSTPFSSTIAAAVEEQGAATQEISRKVQQAAHGTQQVSANITDVQRGATETGSASSQVLSAVRSLSGDSSRLRLEVGKFLESVRAA